MAFSIDGLVNGRLGTAAGLGGITGAVKNRTGLDIAAEAGNAAKAFFGNEYMRDFTHASKTFIPNNYAYAPKFKHLFHVYFDINTFINFLKKMNDKEFDKYNHKNSLMINSLMNDLPIIFNYYL